MNTSQVPLKLVLQQFHFTSPNHTKSFVYERREMGSNRNYFLLMPGIFTCCIFPPDKQKLFLSERNRERKCKVLFTQAARANKNPNFCGLYIASKSYVFLTGYSEI